MKISRILTTFAALSLIVLSATGCKKEGMRLFEGYYSYKLSGTIEVERVLKNSSTDEGTEATPITLTLRIPNESGQMHILSMEEEGRALVTMNAMLGDANTMEATTHGSTLTVDSATRNQRISGNGSSVNFAFSVSGSASKLDNMLVFDLVYAGEGQSTLYTYRVLSSDITCVATENE